MSLGKKSYRRETALRCHPRALENTYQYLPALTLPVPSVLYAIRGRQHQRTAALEMRHNRLPSWCKHRPPCRLSSHDVSMLQSSPPSIIGERRTRRPDATTWPGRRTLGRIDPGTWYLVLLTFVIQNLCRMTWMDTNYNSANVLHALFDVIERNACLEKLFAEGNYCTRHGLPSRLLDVWHVTYFRVRDWVTRSIRGAGREFYRRRVFFLPSRPATVCDSCFSAVSSEGNFEYFFLPQRNGSRVRVDSELDDIIQVA